MDNNEEAFWQLEATDIDGAVANAYAAVDKISFANAYCRRDIAHRALNRGR